MKDPQTLVHKGYGFVSFVNKIDAETAINQMNGQWLNSRKIRTNWAARKVTQPTETSGMINKFKLDYSEVWSRASDTNTTVYCGGITNITEDLVRATFGMYGPVVGIHAFPDRGYAFIRFANKEAACSAICGVHGQEINGFVAKCSWGKENIDITGSHSTTAPQQQVAGLAGLSAGANSLYGNMQSLNSLAGQLGQNNPWAAAAAASTQNSGWTPNYQWAGYPQNTMNYQWAGYPANYQGMLAAQGWGVMPAATGAANGAGANGPNGNSAAQYSLGQYQQNTNGK